MQRRWIVLCIPGRDDAPASWFAYDRLARRSIRCESREAAAVECAHRNDE